MTLQTFTHPELVKSPLNVRTNDEDANAVDALSASIVAEGLLEPLIVHPLAGKTKRWGVIAGARRLKAIGAAIARADLPADFPIAADVRDGLSDGQLILLSLSENLLRRDLRAYETHSAIAAAQAAGLSAEQIAADTGQTLDFVHQQLRLGHLAPEIFTAYAEGKLSGEQAKAYAATEDHELQRAAWQHFTGSLRHHHGADAIRAFFKIGDRELGRLLRFVGEQTYRSAGGTFELDLFADGPEHRGRVVDEGLLRQLAETRLARIREEVPQRVGIEDLRFAAEPPKSNGYTDSGLELDEDEALKVLMANPEADVVATLTVDDNGKAEPRYWWASRKAKSGAQRARPASSAPPTALKTGFGGEIKPDNVMGHSGGQYEQQARAAVRDQYGLTADGLEVMRSLRRDLLRAALMCNASAGGSLGRDYLVWSQLRQELGRDRQPTAGARGLTTGVYHGGDDEPAKLAEDWLADVDARKHWHAVVEELRRQPFMELDDPAAAFRAYVSLDETTKDVAAAILAGCALLRSLNAPGWKLPVHDALAELAGASDDQLRRFWTPDSAFAGLFPKMKRLELAQPHVGAAEFKGWHKLDDKVLTGAVAGALAHAEGWVHPLLSFGVAKEQPAAAGPEDDADEPDHVEGDGPDYPDAPPNVNDALVQEAAPAPMPA